MPVTKDQATQELRRREAVAELQRRQSAVPQQGIAAEPVQPGEFPTAEEERTRAWTEAMMKSGRIKPEKSFWGKMRQEIPQMAGETVGAVAGAKVGYKATGGNPWGAFIGAVGGAGIGAMGGKGYQQLYRMDKGEPMTLGQIFKEQGIASAEGSISEVVGEGITRGAGKIAKPLISKVIPGTPRLSKILTEAGKRMPTDDLTPYAQKILRKRGAFLTAAQLTESRGMDFVESATESTIFGGNAIFQIKKVLNPRAYKQAAKELSDTFWSFAEKRLSPQEMGKAFSDAITNTRKIKSRLARTAYGQVDELTQGMGKTISKTDVVPSSLLDELGQPFTKEVTTSRKVALDLRGIKVKAKKMAAIAERSNLGSAKYTKRIADAVSEWPDYVDSFLEGHSLRSDLLEEVRMFELADNIKLPKVHRNADTLAALTDQTMQRAAKAHSEDAYLAWRAADKLVKDTKGLLHNEVIDGAVKLAYRNPEKVAPSLFTRHGTETLQKVRAAVDDKTYRALLASKLDDLMEKSSRDDILLGKNFRKKLGDLGSDMHAAMFDSPQHYQDVLDIAKLGEIITAPTGGGGGMVAQLTQAGAIIDLGVGLPTGKGLKKGSGVILLGPALLGRIMATPSGAKWFSTGFKLNNAKYWAKMPPAVVRILREVNQANLQEKQQSTGALQKYAGRKF
jgi:hypothetical protein